MTEIRSFRSVFALERRVYRVDRLRLNPGGVPVRGIAYFVAILLAVLLGERLPLLGLPLRILPWYVREVALPAAAAALFTLIRVEGRPFHLAGLALLRYALGARELSGLRPRTGADRRLAPEQLLVLVDGSEHRLRRLRYRGPGAALVCVAHICEVSRRLSGARVRVRIAPLPGRPAPARGRVIELAAGARLDVRPGRGQAFFGGGRLRARR